MNVSDEVLPVPRHLPAGALGGWLAELQGLLGLDEQIDAGLVLDVAGDVSHGIAPGAAPLTTFALGLAVARAIPAGTPLGPELARLAALARVRAQQTR